MASDRTLTPILIGANCKLRLKDARNLAQYSHPVQLSIASTNAVEKAYQFLKNCIDERLPIYGINTHFGDQVHMIEPTLKEGGNDSYYKAIHDRQKNLIRSHTCGLGPPLPTGSVKVAMMLRAHCLSQGYSGISPHAIETLLNFLNSGIVPLVPCYGSIGASGDLIPLSFIASALLGEDVSVLFNGEKMSAAKAIELAGLSPLEPSFRDGLALINGTSMMTAIASLAIYNLKRAFNQMLSAIAMVLEALQVIESAYHPLVHQLKNHAGEIEVNEFLVNFWQGSRLLRNLDEVRQLSVKKESDIQDTIAVQDYYSLRSVSQGFGPFQENLKTAIYWIENEMNSVNDNPIIDPTEEKIHHSANFMGYYVTDACDTLKLNIAQASSWLHALLANLVHPRKNQGLPANLVKHPGKQNGFRPIQLLTAAIAVQNRKLAQGHQAYMLPTEGDNQDVNSLGMHAALDLQEAVANLERLIAILLLAAVQALELRDITKASKQSQAIYHVIREYSPTVGDCRPMAGEINNIIHVLHQEIF